MKQRLQRSSTNSQSDIKSDIWGNLAVRPLYTCAILTFFENSTHIHGSSHFTQNYTMYLLLRLLENVRVRRAGYCYRQEYAVALER